MKQLIPALIALSLSVASILFAVSPLTRPPPPVPPVDKYGCLHPDNGRFAWIYNSSGVMLHASLCDSYQDQLSAWNNDYSSLVRSLSLQKTASIEIAEGFIVIFALCLAIPRLKAPKSLRREVTLPKPHRFATISIGVAGFGVFGYAELFNVLYANTGYPLFIHLFDVDPQMPVHAVLGLALACLCFGILKAKKGLSEGVRSGIMFGAVSVLVAQSCLLTFDYKEMTLHVTAFSSGWILFGVPVFNNWFALIVASFFTLLGALPLLLPKMRSALQSPTDRITSGYTPSSS